MTLRLLHALTVGMLLVSTASPAADDGAASVGAGGLVTMKRETRIVMAKETLTISPERVSVDYLFRNDTSEAVTTEVAFPIPAYGDDPDAPSPKMLGFDDFKLWINESPATFVPETRAFTSDGKELTSLLAGLHVDAGTFGHDDGRQKTSGPLDIARLSPADRNRLVAAHAIASDGDRTPLWEVRKLYHWSQAFPPHSTVRIRHQYSPVLGSTNSIAGDYLSGGKATKEEELPTVCLAPQLLQALRRATGPHKLFSLSYVDFILTTANTWKQPIEDFTLIVERETPHGPFTHGETGVRYVSFCWDGPVTKLDERRFSAHATNFVPGKELRVGYLSGYTFSE